MHSSQNPSSGAKMSTTVARCLFPRQTLNSYAGVPSRLYKSTHATEARKTAIQKEKMESQIKTAGQLQIATKNSKPRSQSTTIALKHSKNPAIMRKKRSRENVVETHIPYDQTSPQTTHQLSGPAPASPTPSRFGRTPQIRNIRIPEQLPHQTPIEYVTQLLDINNIQKTNLTSPDTLTIRAQSEPKQKGPHTLINNINRTEPRKRLKSNEHNEKTLALPSHQQYVKSSTDHATPKTKTLRKSRTTTTINITSKQRSGERSSRSSPQNIKSTFKHPHRISNKPTNLHPKTHAPARASRTTRGTRASARSTRVSQKLAELESGSDTDAPARVSRATTGTRASARSTRVSQKLAELESGSDTDAPARVSRATTGTRASARSTRVSQKLAELESGSDTDAQTVTNPNARKPAAKRAAGKKGNTQSVSKRERSQSNSSASSDDGNVSAAPVTKPNARKPVAKRAMGEK